MYHENLTIKDAKQFHKEILTVARKTKDIFEVMKYYQRYSYNQYNDIPSKLNFAYSDITFSIDYFDTGCMTVCVTKTQYSEHKEKFIGKTQDFSLTVQLTSCYEPGDTHPSLAVSRQVNIQIDFDRESRTYNNSFDLDVTTNELGEDVDYNPIEIVK